MAFVKTTEAIDDLRRALSSARSPETLVDVLAEHLMTAFRPQAVRVALQSGGELLEALRGEIFESVTPQPRFDGGQVKLAGAVLPFPIFVSDPRRSRLEPEVLHYLGELGSRSYAAVALYQGGMLCGWLEVLFRDEYWQWSRDDAGLLQQMADFGRLAFGKQGPEQGAPPPEVPALHQELDDLKAQYERILQYGNLIIVRTNPDLEVIEVHGDTFGIFGVSPDEMLHDRSIWQRLLHVPDMRDLARTVRRSMNPPAELNEEIRFVNQQTREVRWLMLRGLPLFGPDEEFCGWEGFGLDITERHRASEELIEQSKRVEALYEVARALQVNLDPALVTLRGLRALITATNSDSGFACFYDREQSALELVSSEGLSADYIENLSKILNGPTLVRYAVEHQEGLLINDIQKDTRAAVDIAKKEGLRSTIVMPLLMKDEVHGALVLFCRKANRYNDADFDLVSAGASQVCLAVRQAESYLAEKRQVNALAALYRLSHELSKQMSPREVAEHAFPIIQGEFACKRMWLGVLNEQGSHVLGQAGMGPGVRRHLIDMQIELDEPHEFLDEAIQKKQAVVVRAGQQMECSRLTRVLQKLNLGMFVIVPLVSLGQVVGVLIVEPALPSTFMIQRKLALLSSMASEIATVILARRFEARMADAEKMRMAGLLASGVAHNFNNMLQAVMGQASLIEMQVGKDSPLSSSARMIIEAASKGAALIKQLLSFSMPGAETKRAFSANKMIDESTELYRSILGSSIVLDVRLEEDVPEILADYGKLQQVLTNLLVNAKEAIGERENGQVRITTRRVRLSSGEVDPELAPGSYLRIDVSDNGAGMDAERQSRCFEPFYTTKNVDARTGLGFNGSGLGLSSAYSIIKGHEGSITVSSTPGEGSLFSLYLPAAVEKEDKTAVGTLKEERPGAPAAIAVVGAELQQNFALLSTIESLGMRMAPLAENEDIVAALQRLGSAFRLVLLEDSPARDSRAVIEAAREVRGELKFLLVSAQPQETAAKLSSIADVAILEKPVRVWAVQAAMKRLLLGRSNGVLARQVEVERDGEGSVPENTQSGSTLGRKEGL